MSSISTERVLFVTAHDDDAVLMGGSFLACAESGDCSVHVACMNTSEATGGSVDEFRRAMHAYGGVTVEAFNRPDSADMSVTVCKELIVRVMSLIRDFRPTLIITNYSLDTHLDHVNTAKIVAQAVTHSFDWGGRRERLCLLEGEISAPLAAPSFVQAVDIEKKIAALRRFTSQMQTFDWQELIRSLNRFRALQFFNGSSYCEAFHIVRIFG